MPLPTGTLTFLFTDVQGSTQLWEQAPHAMRLALARHDEIALGVINACDGLLVKSRGEGDSLFAVFARATDAAQAALTLQTACAAEPWPAETPLSVRMALHTGEVQLRDGDYYGPAINRCDRLRALGHGGQTLLSLTTEELVRDSLPPEACLRDLGEQRLRDLSRPERVFQLSPPGLPDTFPPLKSLDVLPNNLSRQLTSFVGREAEMEQVKKLLVTTCLLTLTGAGGSGKSRLSVQVAADLLEDFPEGVWLAELAPLSDPALVPQAVATAANVREEPGKPLTATLTAAWKPKRLLLILDNCEHLIDACARLADTLLRACPHVTVLATSREPLNIAGETTWRVPTLSLPSTKPPLPPFETLNQYEAVRLFVDRAVSVLPTFAVTSQNAPAVAQICSRLDGIPLAIELAAARVKVLSPEQIAQRLDDQFRLLTGGSRTALPRQQTLRALIDWSHALLTDAEKTLLRRLSVFAGGWTLAAAETVCADDALEAWEVLDVLSHLVDRSLVVVDEGGERYHLLETIRQYGQEKLAEASEADAQRRAHALYFTEFAEEAEPNLAGPEQVEWLGRLDADYGNLRVALAWALLSLEGVEPGLRLAAALLKYGQIRGYEREGYDWLLKMLPRGQAAPARLRARALYTASRLAEAAGQRDKGAGFAQESLALARQVGEVGLLATALDNASWWLAADDVIGKRRLLEEGLALRQGNGDTLGAAWSLFSLGCLERDYGSPTAAVRLHQESLSLGRQSGDRHIVALNLQMLARGSQLMGEPAAERVYLEEALPLIRELGQAEGIGAILTMLGVNYDLQGDHQIAERLIWEGFATNNSDSIYIERRFGVLSSHLAYQEQYEGALAQLEQAIALLQEADDTKQLRFAWADWGHIHLCLGRWPEAKTALARGVGIYEEEPDAASHSLGFLALRENDHNDATARLGHSLADAVRRGMPLNASLDFAGMAAVAAGRKQWERAARLLGVAEGLRWEKAVRDLPDAWRFRPHKALYTEAAETIKAALDPERFDKLRAEGRAMTLEQAVAYAVEG